MDVVWGETAGVDGQTLIANQKSQGVSVQLHTMSPPGLFNE